MKESKKKFIKFENPKYSLGLLGSSKIIIHSFPLHSFFLPFLDSVRVRELMMNITLGNRTLWNPIIRRFDNIIIFRRDLEVEVKQLTSHGDN